MLARPANDFEIAVQRTLDHAVRLGAHDIYLRPQAGGALEVELGIDGRVTFAYRIPDSRHADYFFKLFKQRAGCNLAHLRVPQDSRFSTDTADFRASIVPTLHGEDLTLRVLPHGVTFDLATYPMPEAPKAALQVALERGSGLIVVSGPTGSGKTTLLHHATSVLNDGTRAINSIEDPIEYVVPGIRQSEVTPGNPPAALLSAILRQNPHVILVGEIRDRATAALAVQATKSGHLVLTTVHAGQVAAIGPRLVGLGVDPDDLAEQLAFASTQRLVPALCERCRDPDHGAMASLEADAAVLFAAGPPPDLHYAFRSAGCPDCHHTGVRGRVLIVGFRTRSGSGQTLLGAAASALNEGAIDVDGFRACL